jgi:hypothetical protein
LVLLGSCFITGCGGNHLDTFPVRGQVAFADGSTLPDGGYVLFTSSDLAVPVRASGAFGAEGNFQLSMPTGEDGLIAGNYNVSVVPNIPEKIENLSPAEYLQATQPIEKKYAFPKSSGLNFTVAAETSPHNFKIVVTKPRRRRR